MTQEFRSFGERINSYGGGALGVFGPWYNIATASQNGFYDVNVALNGYAGAAAASVGNFLASGNMSAGFMPGGVGLGVSWGSQSQNTNLPGFGQGGHNANWGGGSNDGVGFNSLADLGRQAQSLVSEAGNLFSTIGNFFSSAASSVGKFFRGLFSPVALDLNGDGVQLTPASEGNKFYDMAGDGYQHLTAWTAAGDAILGYDANNDGKIDRQNEIVFTQWDPTAASDMQALRNVFDTNQNGKLDAGDAQFSRFRLLVSNADGTQGVKTLAEAGIASIGLVEDQTTRRFADGSTTIDTTTLDAEGGVASRRIQQSSADGKTTTLSVDLDGDGVIDEIRRFIARIFRGSHARSTLTGQNPAPFFESELTCFPAVVNSRCIF
jgi:hypothetical protein